MRPVAHRVRRRSDGVRLLLDTHVFVWALLEPERLGRPARRALEAPGTEIWLSPITVWEVLVLAETGRLALRPDPVSWVRSGLAQMAPREAPLTTEVAVRSRVIDLSQSDPADRFLAATAELYDLTLLTADKALLRGKGYQTLKA